MKVNLSLNAGFCPGVRRADECVRELLKTKSDSAIFTMGSLIHNRIYNEELRGLGVNETTLDELISFLEKTKKDTVLVARTHGITKEESEILRGLTEKYDNFSVYDMTCPFVKKIHKIVDENTKENVPLVLFCDKNHPEARGILSYAHGKAYPVSSLEELCELDFIGNSAIFCSQTTQNLFEFIKIKNFSKKVCTNPIFFDTICNITENRQEDAVRIAKASDAMIVIGGRESSNTKKLFDLSKKHCKNTQWIETLSELNLDFLNNAKSIGITAGASTPDGIITEVLRLMENNFGAMLEESLKTLHTGETVTGTVVEIGKSEIKLDLGTKFTGILPKEQITDDPQANLYDMFTVGSEISVFVIRVEDGKGIATVSKKRVDADNSWVVLKEAFDNGEILEGKVSSVVKGGVIVSVDANNVFVPASQTGIPKGQDVSVLKGTTQKIKLLEFNESNKRALGSIKVILNEEKKAKEDAIYASLEVGKHYMGKVKNLTSYGAFVDIGGVDGMVHNTELSWKRIKHPSQILSVGQEIDVFIKEFDADKKRISLGYKTQEMDTWYQFTKKFNVGDIVSAKIVSIMPFGAFAEVFEDVDGLIHISKISTQRINSPADVLKVGDVVDVKITEIDDDNRKLALSIRDIIEEAERAEREAQAAIEREKAAAEAKAEEERLAQERADMAPYIVGSI